MGGGFRRPYPAPPAGGKTPNPRRPGGIVPPRPGVGKGAGPGGLWPPERRPGPAPRRTTGRGRGPAPAPTPPPGRWGGPRRGRSGKAQAGHGRRPGRQPHAQAAAASDRATAPTAERPGGGAAAPRTQAASNETGRRPTTGRGPRRQPPANTNGGEGPRAGAGQGRAAAMGRGRPGRASTGPACTRPAAYLSGPARHLRGRAGHRHGGGPGRRALCARDSGRAEGPRGGRIRTRFYGAGGCRSGTGWGGRIEAGATPPGRGAASAAKKNGRGAFPPAGHDWTKKKCGEDALSPPLAVTADTRFPPVRRSSPKRTRCRPVPCALAMRRLPRPPSCLP